MKIAFFSCDEGYSSGLAALLMTIEISEKFSLSTVMIQNKSSYESVEHYFRPLKQKNMFREENIYFALDGMDFLIWLYRNKRITWNSVEEVSVPLLGKAIYIPTGMRERSRLYPEKTGDIQWDIVRWFDRMTDVVLADCGCTEDVFSEHLRKDGDVRVICIKHEKAELDRVLVKEGRFYGDEIVLLIDYDFSSVYNRENISRIYRIPSNNIAAIPKNPELESYLEQGRVQKFFRKNLNPVIGRHNSYCMREIREASEKIMEAAYGKMRQA